MKDDEMRKLGPAYCVSETPGQEMSPDFDAGEVWDLVEGKLQPEKVRSLAEAAAENPELAEAWHLAIEIRRERERTKKIVTRPFSPRQWMAMAALLFLVLLSPLLVQHFRTQPVLRGEGTTGIESLVEDGSVLPRNHFILRWRDTSGKVRSWDLVVMKGDLGEILSKEGLSRSEFHVPAEALADLKVGKHVLWQVTSHREDGSLKISKTFVVILGQEQ